MTLTLRHRSQRAASGIVPGAASRRALRTPRRNVGAILVTMVGIGSLVMTGCSTAPSPQPLPTLASHEVLATPSPRPLGEVPLIADTSIDALVAALPSPPVGLTIESLGIGMEVSPQGLAPDGSMAIPALAAEAGWYRHGAAPGSDRGNVVVAAHVDDAREGLGPFALLKDVAVGATVTVTDANGISHDYVIVAKEQTAKSTVDPAVMFAQDGPERLVLVTCGGRFDWDTRHYDDNVIIWAEPHSASAPT
jgi:hypothetical protein